MRSRNLKRLMDLMVATVLLGMLSPVLLGVALLVRLKMGSPVIFCQIRPGLCGRPFMMYKFRTMLDLRDKQGNLLPDAQRLTKLGKLIRKLSLDEIPELWNVFKGDMSLVGPRPLLMEYLSYYTAEQALRHKVKPGITGWAVVHGRNMLDWNEKFKLDVWYVQNQNLWLDLKILALTVWKVLRREGVSFPGYETMPKFAGEKR
jgi:sugar transferase EpsL